MAKGLEESGPLQILKKLMTIDNERLVSYSFVWESMFNDYLLLGFW